MDDRYVDVCACACRRPAARNLILGRYLPTHDHEKWYLKFLLARWFPPALAGGNSSHFQPPASTTPSNGHHDPAFGSIRIAAAAAVPTVLALTELLLAPGSLGCQYQITFSAASEKAQHSPRVFRSLPPQREPTPAQHHVNCSSPALNICRLQPSRDTPYPVPCGSHGLLAFASSDDMHKAFASLTSPHPAAPAITGPSSLRQECFTPATIPDAARRSRPLRVLVSLSNQRPGAREMDWESKTAWPTCPQRRVMDFSPRPLAECRTSPVNPESVDDPWDRPDPGHPWLEADVDSANAGLYPIDCCPKLNEVHPDALGRFQKPWQPGRKSVGPSLTSSDFK
ncbi:hypothetical protein CPLU01_05964 [Colletotrichum plurivorum]|uniref:Uncharacterized protein n=1 Tax=Colletotrichum plurivorum TaxID=2175906 RepID=A0A8H6NHG4_9PEZI|nr:hypothetical protein CPLU01_05964 [Colletotrichum plurivorum]